MRQLEENKADLTSHLQQILQRKTEESQELQERLIALEKLRKDEQKAFKIKEDSLEQEFKLMENNLNAEITLAGTTFIHHTIITATDSLVMTKNKNKNKIKNKQKMIKSLTISWKT